jgi:hypothetical protein
MYDDVQDSFADPGTLEGVRVIRLDTNDTPLRVLGDASLDGRVHLQVEAGSNAPSLVREGDELVLYQRGRFRGTTPVLLVPQRDCPPIEGSHDKGEVIFDQVVAPVSLSHGMGDLRATGGRGELALRVGKGDVLVESRRGVLALKLGMGDIRVARSTGLMALSLGKGDIVIDTCEGDIAVKSGMGDLVVGDTSGALTIKSGTGDLEINRPRHQAITLNSASGDVHVRQGAVTALRIKAGRGDVHSSATLVHEAGVIEHPVDDPDDDELLASAGASFAEFEQVREELLNLGDLLRSKGLELELGDKGVRLAGGPIAFEASEQGVRFGKGDFQLEISDEGIRVNRGDERTSGAFDIATGKGDIFVDVPVGVPIRVEALVNGGDVHSDIPLVSVGRPGPRGTVQRFVGATGSPSVTDRLNVRLRTDRGDIRVRSVAVVSTPPVPPRPRAPQPPQPPQPPVAPVSFHDQPTQRVASPPPPSREERMRAILDALSRGELTITDAERQLAELDSQG